MEELSKENIATLASIYYIAMKTIDNLKMDNIDPTKLATIVTNTILEKCTEDYQEV